MTKKHGIDNSTGCKVEYFPIGSVILERDQSEVLLSIASRQLSN